MIVIIDGEKHTFTEPSQEPAPTGVILGYEDASIPGDLFRSLQPTGSVFLLSGLLDGRLVRRIYRRHTWQPSEDDQPVIELSERII